MLRLPPFEYLSPVTLKEALELKDYHAENAMFTSGGTDLYPNMKRRQFSPRYLIGLRRIKEMKVLETKKGLRIGAGVSLDKIASHPIIREKYSALASAADLVSSPTLRVMGTLGGNLCLDTRCTYYNQNFSWRKALGFCMKKDGDICWVARNSTKCLAVSSSDCAPAVIALGGTIHLQGPRGFRSIPASQFYVDDGINYTNKKPDELVVSLSIPDENGRHSAYCKLRKRGTIDFPVLGVAVTLSMDPQGICKGARIVLGAVSSAPILAKKASDKLVGFKLEEEKLRTVALEASRLAKPMDNTDMNLGYRKKVLNIYIERTLKKALKIVKE